jgi:HEAT repeat protein
VKDSVVGKIVRLLGGDSAEKQIAAAVVLGELGVRDAAVIDGLVKLLASPLPPVQRQALLALAALGARKALPVVLPLLAARDAEVRAAAADAVAALGEEAVPALRERLAAAPAAEKRALEELLGRVGGRDALSTLLAALAPDDLEGARAAVLPLRQHLKEADGRERRTTLEMAKRVLEDKGKGKGKGKKAAASPAARLVALKVLGFVADPASGPRLLAIAGAASEPEPLREEAVIALRLSLAGGKGLPPKIAAALVTLAEKAPLKVAQAALYSLVGTTIAPPLARGIGRLAAHPETARALIAIDLLGQAGGGDGAAALAAILLETDERTRAEAAAAALGKRPEAGSALCRALLATSDRDRAELCARLLRPHLGEVDRALVKPLVQRAAERLEAAHATAEPLLQIARALDAAGAAEALRALAAKLRKAGKHDPALRVLRTLGRSRDAAPADGYALGALELGHGLKDEAFTIFAQLADRGYDVAADLRKDRSLDDRLRYDAGFHFIERGHRLGEEILTALAEAGGRTKLAQMARAKLKSAGF